MRKLRRVNIERSEEIFEKIGKYVDAIVAKLNPHKIILFGSFARGDFNEASDVDILVISDFHESFLERSKTLTKYNDFGLPLEPVGYTPQEFEERANTATGSRRRYFEAEKSSTADNRFREMFRRKGMRKGNLTEALQEAMVMRINAGPIQKNVREDKHTSK